MSGRAGRRASRKRRKPRPRLGRLYWDSVAPRWRERIFNTLAEDRGGTILAELARAARGAGSVADFGCGVGVYFPTLARLFDEVHGFDHSPACVERARRRARGNGKVAVHVAGSAPRASRGRFDVVLCVNAALHPLKRVWHGVLRSARDLLNARGTLIVVVPALESADLVARAKRVPLRSRAGVAWLGGVPTKHYARGELAQLLAGLGLRIARIRRVEYSWRSHNAAPPPALKRARPWDWIAVARNGRRAPARLR